MSNSYIICRVFTFSLFNITLFGLAVSIRGNSTIKNAIETQFFNVSGIISKTWEADANHAFIKTV